uniref:Uncharacterized protein n=1 Tax=viral metagenome TaxID=1070528 RepID=A0A6C0HWM9_9ZZZZ
MSRKIYLDKDWNFSLPENKDIIYYHDIIGNKVITHGKFKSSSDVSHRYLEACVIELEFYNNDSSKIFILSTLDDVCLLYYYE